MIANKAYHPESGYNYQELPRYRSLSSPLIPRRHSFSSFEQATYKKPTSVDTTSAFSKPFLTVKVVDALTGRAFGLGHNTSDLMITYAFTKKALKALSLPPLQVQTSLASEKISTHPHFEWSLIACRILKTNLGKIVVTKDHAINICDPSKEGKYYRKLQNEEQIIGRTNPSNQEIGLTQEKITHLGTKKFYLHDCNKTPKGFYAFHGFSHMTEAHLEDCSHIKFSSKEELLTAASYLIHQVDILHRSGVCHMDIKPSNICKTKDGKFKLIDRYGSLDFTRKDIMVKVQNGKFDTTKHMIPESLFYDLTEAETTLKAKKRAKIADVFATGSTIYQLAFAFMSKSSLNDQENTARLPYNLDPNGHPFCLRPPEKFAPPLKVLSPGQQQLIKNTLLVLVNKQPTLKELKESFPISEI